MYGGTKTEMERLLKDAKELTGVEYDINKLSDVYNAIHAIQENLGITGTTAKEAMYTIEGSANMTRAAWENVVIAIGRGEGLNEALNGLTTAIFGQNGEGGLLNNIIPRIQTTMEGIANFIVTAAPMFAEIIPKIFDVVFPSLLSTAVQLVGMLAKQLPSIGATLINSAVSVVKQVLAQISKAIVGYDMFDDFSSFTDGLLDILTGKIPEFANKALEWIKGFAGGMGGGITDITEKIELLVDVVMITLQDWIPNMIQIGLDLLQNLGSGIIEGIPVIVEFISNLQQQIIEYLTSFDTTFLDSGVSVITNFITGMIEQIPFVIETLGEMITRGLEFFFEVMPQFLDKGIEIITSIANGILENIPSLILVVGDMLASIISLIMENLPTFIEKGVDLIGNLIVGIYDNIPNILNAITDVLLNLIETILNKLPDFLRKGKELLEHIGRGIVEKAPDIIAKMLKLIVDLIAKIAQKLPDFLRKGNEIVGEVAKGIIQSIPDILRAAGQFANDTISKIKEIFRDTDWLSIGSNIIDGIIEGLWGGINSIWDAAQSVASSAFDAACNFLEIFSPSKKGRYIGRMFDLGIAEDIEDNAPVDEARNMVKSVFDSANNAMEDINVPITTSIDGKIGAKKSENMIQELIALLSRYLPEMANSQVYLYPSKRAYVADVVGDMNDALGELARWEAVQ